MARRLIKVAKEFGLGISDLVEILDSNGYQIENKPTAKVSDEAFEILVSHITKPASSGGSILPSIKAPDESELIPSDIQIDTVTDFCEYYNLTFSDFDFIVKQERLETRFTLQSEISADLLAKVNTRINTIQNESKEIEEMYPRGTIIQSEILDVKYPCGIKVKFDKGYIGYLPIQNLAPSIFHAENIFKNYSLGNSPDFVVYGYDHIHKVCILSVRHLRESKPARLKKGEVARGKVIEQLKTKSIIQIEGGGFGILNSVKGNSILQVLGYNDYRETYSLVEYDEKNEGNKIKKEKIKHKNISFIEPELRNYLNFEKSSYGATATVKEKSFLRELLRENKKLFFKELNFSIPIILKFINDRSWDDFKREAGEDNIKEAFQLLSESDYWVRYHTNEKRQSEELILFNEQTYIKAKVDILGEDILFIITSFGIGRKNKWTSNSKMHAANSGAILNQTEIIFLSPYDSIPFDSDQENLIESIRNKFKAFDIHKSLKERTGVILQTEGEALKIFQNFLDYQIAIEKRKEREPIKIEILKKFPSSPGWSKYQFKAEENFNIQIGRVEIGENKLTQREKSNETFMKFDSGKLVEEFSELFLEVKDTIDFTNLNKDIYIRESLHVFHLESQKEIIQDFLNKKINVSHIEKLLIDPESIKSPQTPRIEFNNEDLNKTFQTDPFNKQIEAVRKGVGNQNILLIQGPPGTGKTTVIAEIVEQLINKGEKILIASQGHVAVDNVLEKFEDANDLLMSRIGNEDRINPKLVKFQEEKAIELFTEWYSVFIQNQLNLANEFLTIDNIKEKINEYSASYPKYLKGSFKNYHHSFYNELNSNDESKIELLKLTLSEWQENISIQKDKLIKPLFYKHLNIAFGTCLGLRNSKELNKYNVKFDTLILDEAGKANMAETFVAISLAKKVILVGDQKQLPPYLDSNMIDPDEEESFPNSKLSQKVEFEKLRNALSTSFFEFLVNRIEKGEFPKANLVMLDIQHRMHPSIGNLVSESFYNSKVLSAHHTKKNRVILPAPFDKEIVFVDTSNDSNPYEMKVLQPDNTFSYRNELEAAYISKEIIPKLLEGGVNSENFAVISPYKEQVKHIKKCLTIDIPQIVINVETLDSFQGKEFDIIIISFTRSSKSRRVGFLDDARRLNVALSRAKKKLILVGNAKTLCNPRSHFDKIFKYTKLFKKIVTLSSNNETGNFFQLSDKFSFIPRQLGFDNQFLVGEIVSGKVTRIENYGVLIRLNKRDSGLLHVSNMTVERPLKSFSEGQNLEVYILKIDARKKRISLGLEAPYLEMNITEKQNNPKRLSLNGKEIIVGNQYVGEFNSKEENYFRISLFKEIIGRLKITDETTRRIKNLDQLPEGFKIIKVRVTNIKNDHTIILTLD